MRVSVADAKNKLPELIKAAENGELSNSIIARLDLGKKGKWDDMLKGIINVRELEDPGRQILDGSHWDYLY